MGTQLLSRQLGQESGTLEQELEVVGTSACDYSVLVRINLSKVMTWVLGKMTAQCQASYKIEDKTSTRRRGVKQTEPFSWMQRDSMSFDPYRDTVVKRIYCT